MPAVKPNVFDEGWVAATGMLLKTHWSLGCFSLCLPASFARSANAWALMLGGAFTGY
ncbi:MAG: hypothetical protein ABJD13_15210 [Paracoccaceae bacterium]